VDAVRKKVIVNADAAATGVQVAPDAQGRWPRVGASMGMEAATVIVESLQMVGR
jgi:hypothetical protein